MSEPIIYCEKCLYHAGPLKDSMVLKNATHAGGPQGICGGTWKVHKPIYVGIFLSEKSKKELLEKVPPKHPELQADHITLAFGRHMSETYPIGKEVLFAISDELWDERGHAVVVKSNWVNDLKHKDQEPHITISCAKGIKPIYSNELLKSKAALVRVGVDIILEGKVDYFPRIVP